MRNYTVGRIWGIPIRLNISLLVFLPILAYLIGSGQQLELYGGFIADLAGQDLEVGALREARWTIGVLAAVGLFAGVLLHELGHSYVALRYGIGISSITLWIFGGVAALDRIPEEWNREFWIAVAGPVVSVAVGVVCLLSLPFLPAGYPVLLFVVGWLGVVNIVLAVFNLLPAFPMDGGRILRALLARSMPRARATNVAANVGVGFSFVFIVFGALAFNIILILIGFFVYLAAKNEARVTAIAEALDGFTVGDVVTRSPRTIDADASLEELADRVLDSRATSFTVVDDGEYVGFVNLDHGIRKVGHDERATTKVRDVMTSSDVVLDAGSPAFDGYVEIATARADHAVVERDGETVGLVGLGDFYEVMQIASLGVGKREEMPEEHVKKLERGYV